MTFINGPPAIGKSIRVSFCFLDISNKFISQISQYLNDDHFDKQWPIRILHSCSTSLSANALSSFKQPIDCFTFDNMYKSIFPLFSKLCFSIRSLINGSTSLITITTHEFLLHTLISGDWLLKSSITHLIIDDVHRRSHTLDMLLAYLKDAQQKFRHLKIIFIQTTIQYDTLVKYFGNVATYTSIYNFLKSNFYSLFVVEMKTKDVEEVFLDQILIDIQRFDQNKCLSIGKNRS